MAGPLKGIRVLAVERALAGPYGSMILGDLGAEVIKIEPPGGEQARRTRTPPLHKGEPAYFLAFNRNKKSVVLDLLTETGREAFYDLARISDVVWDNNRPGIMERLRIDHETVRSINPRIVSCSITGYGATGPCAAFPSYDIIAQGMSGMLLQTGEPGGPPIKPAAALADISAAMFGVMGVTSALWERERTGTGQKIETNLLDSSIALLSMHYAIYFLDGVVPPPVGAGHLQAAPFGVFKTRDGWISIGFGWPRLARTLDIEWVLDDPRFATLDDRIRNRRELDAIITEALSRMDSAAWLDVLHADDIPCGPVYNLDQAPEDPQIKHNEIFMAMEHPLGGQVRLVGNPVRMPGIRSGEYTPPPTLGQHTHEVLSETLGYPEDKIRRLLEEQERHAAELEEHYERKR